MIILGLLDASNNNRCHSSSRCSRGGNSILNRDLVRMREMDREGMIDITQRCAPVPLAAMRRQ